MVIKQFRLAACCLLLAFVGFAQQNSSSGFKPYVQQIPGSTVKFRMAPIPAGTFIMGSDPAQKGHQPDEAPKRRVSVSAFWMGTHEVTHDEFLLFLNDESVSRNTLVDAVTRPTPQYVDLSWGMGKQGGFPVNSMSQLTALMYCKWLYTKTGIFYRLPTEAEWEYACRAGSTGAYFFGNDAAQLGHYAWYAGNSDDKYHKVGQKKPNAWGLYDMLGNVSEWTLDQYNENYYSELKDGVKDPINGPVSKYPKSVRGGGYTSTASELRAAARIKSEASWNKRDPQIPKSKWWLTDASTVGFRVVRPAKQPTAAEAEAFFKKYLNK